MMTVGGKGCQATLEANDSILINHASNNTAPHIRVPCKCIKTSIDASNKMCKLYNGLVSHCHHLVIGDECGEGVRGSRGSIGYTV